MTAYEVAARNQEKLQVLGPVIERLQNEALGPSIKRIFKILERKGLLPPLPPTLRSVPLGVEYVGILSLAQKAATTAALEQFANSMNAQQQLHPEIADVWDVTAWSKEIAQGLFIPVSIMNKPEKIAALRDARAKQQQAAAAMAAAQHASETAQNLGNTDVGGGMSAMAAMTGLGSSGIGGGPQPGLAGAQPAGNA
jgi:hypothetical protein